MIIYDNRKIKFDWVNDKQILTVNISKTNLNSLSKWNKLGNEIKIYINKPLDTKVNSYRLIFNDTYFLERNKKRLNINIILEETIKGKTTDPIKYKGFMYINKKESEVIGVLCPNIYTHRMRYGGGCTCDFRREIYDGKIVRVITSSANNMTIWKVVKVSIKELLDWDLSQKELTDLTNELKGSICKHKYISNEKFIAWRKRNNIESKNVLVNENSTVKSFNLDEMRLIPLK